MNRTPSCQSSKSHSTARSSSTPRPSRRRRGVTTTAANPVDNVMPEGSNKRGHQTSITSQELVDANAGISESAKIKKHRISKIPRFGFCLYRLRAHRDRPLLPYETDLPSWFEGEAEYACLMNYLIDLEWLMSLMPSLKDIPKMLIVHGSRKDDRLRGSLEKHELSNTVLHYPPLPIPFGKHHTKACIVKFPDKLRLVIFTANLTYSDCGEKMQGAWVRDFQKKDDTCVASEFEGDLVDYLTALELPEKENEELIGMIRQHDFSTADVKLIASIPGYHKGDAIDKYGHRGMQRCLSRETFSSAFDASPLICQISSVGSLFQNWLLEEFMPSLCAGRADDRDLEPPSKDSSGLQLIWPTIEQVRLSYDGWASGKSTAGLSKNIEKTFLQQYWHKYDGRHLDRDRAIPHIKSYTRYARHRLAWVLLTSHNLSRAAWGAMQKQGEQFMIRSFELGVLFLPSLHRGTDLAVDTCTTSEDIAFVPAPSEETDVVQFCLPYQLPPEMYAENDVPSVTDVKLAGVDAEGRKWGSQSVRYGLLEPTDRSEQT